LSEISVREMRREDVKEFVKLLFLCFDELNTLFKDVYMAREIFEKYYSSLENYSGIIVATLKERVVGFAELVTREIKRKGFTFRDFLVFGFIDGLKYRLLLSFFDRKPKKDEVYIRYLCINPRLNVFEIGKRLFEKIFEFASKNGKKRVNIWIPVESDFVDLLMEAGFKVKRIVESRFTEKHLGRRYYYFLEYNLN